MTPLQQLQQIQSQVYVSEDGDEYSVELLPPLSQQQINQLADRLPNHSIPHQIRELMLYAGGFVFYGLDEVQFDTLDWLGLPTLFPHSIQLAGDGFGNFWIQDINQQGQWCHIYYVCHDPAVVVKHSEDLAQFIQHLDEWGSQGEASTLNTIHELTVDQIWRKPSGLITLKDARSSLDSVLRDFANQLPDRFVITDLRSKPIGSGFAWGKSGTDVNLALRHQLNCYGGWKARSSRT